LHILNIAFFFENANRFLTFQPLFLNFFHFFFVFNSKQVVFQETTWKHREGPCPVPTSEKIPLSGDQGLALSPPLKKSLCPGIRALPCPLL
jgi:hypothetical protein